MASNTKYQPTSQRDSFEDTSHFTQAPPSYQAGASGTNDALLGQPRNSEDNVPDDYKVSLRSNKPESDFVGDADQSLQFGGSVAEASIDIRMQFIRKVYAILYDVSHLA